MFNLNMSKINTKLQNAKSRAKQKGLPYDLTLEWYIEKLKIGKCEITGLPFSFEEFAHNKAIPIFTPTIDRVDSSKGYTKDNCQVVVWVYNQIKGESSLEDIKIWGRKFIEVYENETMLG